MVVALVSIMYRQVDVSLRMKGPTLIYSRLSQVVLHTHDSWMAIEGPQALVGGRQDADMSQRRSPQSYRETIQ